MAPIVISSAALAFTLFSFWWIHWRPGRLVVGRPRSFAVLRSNGKELVGIALPLVFINRGAGPVVIQNLRLTVRGPGVDRESFSFNNTASTLDLKAERHMAVPFHVLGNQAVALICEFDRMPGDLLFQAARYRGELDAVLGNGEAWAPVASFHLNVGEKSVSAVNTAPYLALDSAAGAESPSIRARRFGLSVNAA